MSLNSWEIKAPSQEVLNLLAVDCFDKSRHMPIEKICGILYKQYTFDEVRVLEAEFIIQDLQRLHPGKEMDSLFIEKLYAIPAILNSPVLFTMSMTSFFNAVCICNDLPAGTTDVHDVPSRFIPRTIYSINAMLPDDMDFVDIYFYTNVKTYIFNMYKLDDCPVLDPCIAYLQQEFNSWNNSISMRDKLDDITDRIAGECEALYELMDTIRKDSEYGSEQDFGLSGFPVKYKMKYARLESGLLNKFSSSGYETYILKKHINNLLYSSLYVKLSEKMDVKSDIWILCADSIPALLEENKFKDSLIRSQIVKFLEGDPHAAVYAVSEKELPWLESLDRVHTMLAAPAELTAEIESICSEHTPPDNIRISPEAVSEDIKAGLTALKASYEYNGSTFDYIN